MCKKIILVLAAVFVLYVLKAQNARGISMEEYEKAKHFVIKDIDKDTYVKFDSNRYVLDRYESRKPYFITGDDGLKKRIDLYTLLLRQDAKMLGTVIYYTNEKGTRYTVCLPNSAAQPGVWDKYFEDIHAINKEEKDFVLKLSYVLSKEFSYQAYKSTLKGKDPDRSESATYGTEICFPGTDMVKMADGKGKQLKDIKKGDEIVSVDIMSSKETVVKVDRLVEHEARDYAIATVWLLRAEEKETAAAHFADVHFAVLEATPNHPVMTSSGRKPLGELQEREKLFVANQSTGAYEPFIVWNKIEKAHGIQKVYNIEASTGQTFVINGVMVMQKSLNK
jgi:hypothetical protein